MCAYIYNINCHGVVAAVDKVYKLRSTIQAQKKKEFHLTVVRFSIIIRRKLFAFCVFSLPKNKREFSPLTIAISSEPYSKFEKSVEKLNKNFLKENIQFHKRFNCI